MNKRDDKNEVPGNFGQYVNTWSLESITCIALNRRLGTLKEDICDENARKLMQVISASELV
jgi:hypothetical protein